MNRPHKQDEIDFAQAAIDAFRRRSRAIGRWGKLQYTPVKEIVDGRESDRGRTDVTITYTVEGQRVQLRVQVWGDRWVWVDASRYSKSGWVWEFTSEGRFVSPNGARSLVEHAEAMIIASHKKPAAEVPQAMHDIWSKSLAVGPRPA